MPNFENKTNEANETKEEKEFKEKAIKAGFSEVNIQEEIKKINTRLNRLDRGGKEQFKGEKERLIDQLKHYGVEYVGKKAKVSTDLGVDSVENKTDLSEGKNENEISDEKAENQQEIEISKILKKELESLGISDEKLKGEVYRNFNELNSGSKLLVLKNLKGIILDEITEESKLEAKASVGEVKGLFSKIRKGFKENRLANKSREEKLKEIGISGISEKQEEKLNSLSEIMSSLEIDIFEKNGKTEVSLLKEKEGMSDEQKKAIADLNLAANEFLSIPKEMSYESASKSDQKKYEDARNKYLESRAKIVENLGASKDVLDDINKADFQLRMVRDFNNDSVLSEEWKQAVKNPGFFKKIISSMSSKEKMAYTASGYAVRSITGALSLSAAALPFIMTIGSIRGIRSAKEKIKKQDKKDIYKDKIESPLALNRKKIKQEMDKMVPAEFRLDPNMWIDSESANQEDIKKYLDLKMEFLKLDEKLTKEQSEKLNIVSAESLSDKLDSLGDNLKKMLLEDNSDPVKLKDLSDSLLLRVSFTKEKIKSELVNFGSNEKKALNYLDLQRSLDEAEFILNSNEFISKVLEVESANNDENNKLLRGKKLLESILNKHSENLSQERKKYVIKKAVYGALTAGAFAGIGALIREGKDLLSNVDISDVNELVSKDDFETATLNSLSIINEVNELDNIDSANTFNLANTADSMNVSENVAGNYVETNVNISEKLTSFGLDVENMNDKAMKSIEGIGTLQKVVTLEKGDGVSKIFNGIRVHNEYLVTFVDGKTGQMTDGAAFSKMVHPGDQVILGEDGKIYVVCKGGVKDNPFYGKTKDLVDGLEPEGDKALEPDRTEKPEKLDRIEAQPSLDENDKLTFETIRPSEVQNTTIETEGDFKLEIRPNAWSGNEIGNNVVIEGVNSDGKSVLINIDKSDLGNGKIIDIAPISNGYQVVLEDGTSLNFRLDTSVSGEGLPDYYFLEEPVQNLNSVSDVFVGDQGGFYISPENPSNKMISEDLYKKISESFSSFQFNYEDKKIVLDNNIIDFSSFNGGLDEIKSIDPEYGAGGGEPVYFKVVYNSGAMETFKPELNAVGDTIYVKAGDGLVDVSDKVENELNTDTNLNEVDVLNTSSQEKVADMFLKDTFNSVENIKKAFGDLGEKINTIAKDNYGNYLLKMKDGKQVDILVGENAIEIGALKTFYVNFDENGSFSSEELRKALSKHLESISR